MVDYKFQNIILLGFAFMFVFTAFQTCSMIQATVLNSYKDTHPDFNGDGFVSLAIVYIVFAAANWIAPIVVGFLTAKWAMFAGGIVYTLYVALFLHPYTWSLYLGSVLIGIAAAVMWTAQGNFLTVNSDSTTIARNSGIFWAMLQCSLFFGNLFYYYQIGDDTSIDDDTRMIIFYALTAVSVVGILVMLIFRQPRVTLEDGDKRVVNASENLLLSIVNAFKLLMTPRMLLLSFTFFYTGLELGFFSGVYGTCVGNSQNIAHSKRLIGLNGVFIGIGEILGGAIFGLLGKKTIRYGRDPIIMLGYVVHMISFFLVFINLPFQSSLQNTFEPAYIESNVYIAMVCSFLLGFADSCFNTQCYSIVGALYPDDSSAAFALFKFFQSLAAAVSFFYSLGLQLEWQLLILVIFGTVGTITFCKVELDIYVEAKRKLKKDLVTESFEKE